MVRKVKRKISTEKFVLVGIIALIIFLLGLSLGMIIDNERVRWANMEYRNQQLDYESIQLQYLYLQATDDKNESCSALYTSLEQALTDLGTSLEEVLGYQKDTTLNKDEFLNIERRYMIDNFKYWLLVKKAKTECSVDAITVLYFYSETNCEICSEQGIILTLFKKKYGEKLLIFPINVDLESQEPFITIIRETYDVEQYPSIVVEGETYSGIVAKDQLANIFCNENSGFCE